MSEGFDTSVDGRYLAKLEARASGKADVVVFENPPVAAAEPDPVKASYEAKLAARAKPVAPSAPAPVAAAELEAETESKASEESDEAPKNVETRRRR